MNVQRNIFAGLLIFLVFLMVPVYLDFIGINQDDVGAPVQDDNKTEDTVPLEFPSDLSHPVIYNKNKSVNNKTTTIQTEFYKMILSNRGGGSVLYYQLGEKEGYLGSYDNREIYNDSLSVVLVNNYTDESFCSPCLTVNDNHMNQPFSLLTSVHNDSVYVSLDEELKLVYRHEFSDSDYIEKIIIINGGSYSFVSTYNYNLENTFPSNADVRFLWDSGIYPTERGENDIRESHSSAYLFQNGSLESITQSTEVGVDE